ncbi:MAG: helix-turn-helix domain-containing protein [Rhodospirillaceae bacterium]|nr:MAG: helix-turn-helix domain-containing protein [Rhodospirillaceae bacterium]
MKTEVIVIQNERDLKAAQELVTELGQSRKPADVARLRAQALLLQAYEATRWPARAMQPAELIRYAMEQHGLSPADMAPILGTRSRVSEILNGKRPLTLTMIRRLHARLGLPADLLIAERAAA